MSKEECSSMEGGVGGEKLRNEIVEIIDFNLSFHSVDLEFWHLKARLLGLERLGKRPLSLMTCV